MQHLSQQLAGLNFHLGEEDGNADAVAGVIARLEKMLSDVKNADEWTNAELTEFVLSDNDPLDNVDGVSDLFLDDVREFQHAVINHYSA